MHKSGPQCDLAAFFNVAVAYMSSTLAVSWGTGIRYLSSFSLVYYYFFCGFLAGGYAIGRLTGTQGLTAEGGCLGTAIGTLHGVVEATEQVKVINGKYEEHKKVINGLQADLDCLAPKIREKARKVDDMAEAMKDLKV